MIHSENFKWNLTKSRRLKKIRGVSFEEITKAELVDRTAHPQRRHQGLLLFKYRDYIWVVPFVLDQAGDLFLKTLYPSRKYTQKYRKGDIG